MAEAQPAVSAADYAATDLLMQQDLEHYCRVAVTIKDKAGVLVPFVWNEGQREVHEKIERQREVTGKVRAIILKARQRGISTYVGARFYHQTTLSPGLGVNTYILTHLDDATQNLFEMVERIHEHMPMDYRHRLEAANAKELRFEGMDSGYRVGTAQNVSGLGRSLTLHRFHGSEVAFWKQAQAHMGGILQAVPNAPGTEIILESTANGVGGVFYEEWQKAMRGDSEFIAIFLPWFGQIDYRMPVPDGFIPSEQEREYAELYDLDDEQLAWMHYKNVEMGGNPGVLCPLFRQEYPATPNEAFQATGEESYIPSDLVMKARHTTLDEDTFAPLLMGVDVAAGGADRTRMLDRKGRRLGHRINVTMNERDPMVLADAIAAIIEEHEVFHTFIDLTGPGHGVYYRLVQKNYGHKISGINFGADAAEPEKYANKRAEMYGRCLDWLQGPSGADIIDDDVLHEDLCAATFKYRMSKKGRQLILEPKETAKKRLERQRSPDAGDAAVLTFAEHVYVPEPKKPSWTDEHKPKRNLLTA